MTDERETEKTKPGGWFSNLSAWVKLLAAVIGLPALLWGAWEVKQRIWPSATVTFPICTPRLLSVDVFNNGRTTAHVDQMRFEREVDGVSVPREVEALVIVEENAKPNDPIDPVETIPLGGQRARTYQYPSMHKFGHFGPQHRKNCKIKMKVSIRWGETSHLYDPECPCQFPR